MLIIVIILTLLSALVAADSSGHRD